MLLGISWRGCVLCLVLEMENSNSTHPEGIMYVSYSVTYGGDYEYWYVEFPPMPF